MQIEIIIHNYENGKDIISKTIQFDPTLDMSEIFEDITNTLTEVYEENTEKLTQEELMDDNSDYDLYDAIEHETK
jgi:hypothetical protein